MKLIVFWRHFIFIFNLGTIFNAELLDPVTTKPKMDFVLLALEYDFVYHMPQLHSRN